MLRILSVLPFEKLPLRRALSVASDTRLEADTDNQLNLCD